MAVVSIVAVVAGLLGAAGGYALSKQAVEWCPTCGRSLAGHCPDAARAVLARPAPAPVALAPPGPAPLDPAQPGPAPLDPAPPDPAPLGVAATGR